MELAIARALFVTVFAFALLAGTINAQQNESTTAAETPALFDTTAADVDLYAIANDTLGNATTNSTSAASTSPGNLALAWLGMACALSALIAC